ncbi:MAG: HlyC/CorC family transporter [Pseudomonadota bacterium]
MGVEISILCILILLLLSGFFSGSETAMTAASRARLHGWEKEGNKRAGLVNRIRERKERLIGALLLGNNLVNILASALATSVLIKLFGEAGVVYATLVMTILVLIFSEVLPKTYALHNADKMTVAIAPAINIVVYVFAPVAETVNWIVRKTLRLFGTDISLVSKGEHLEVLRGVIDLHEGGDDDEGEAQEQRAMLRSILDLQEVDVEEVMTHRKNVEMIDAGDPIEKIIDDVLGSNYTRLPVYREESDNIVGVLHAKALLRELRAQAGTHQHIEIEEIAADPWFVPESTTLVDQLQAFRQRREHFATVVDEYGAYMGIVTLEDILEEIVGEIDDEHDEAVTGVKKLGNSSYLIDGDVTIRDLNREFEWELPDDEDYSTLAGLIIHEAQTIPKAGQSFIFYDFQFDIVKRQRNQLAQIRVTAPLAQN